MNNPEMLKREYIVINHDGNQVGEPQEFIDKAEAWRIETRNMLLDAFPERAVTDTINPSIMRQDFQQLGFDSAPVVVLPAENDTLRDLANTLTREKILAGNAFDGIESMFTAYMSLTSHSTDLE